MTILRRLFRSLRTLLFQRKYFVAYEYDLNGGRVTGRIFYLTPRRLTQKSVEVVEEMVAMIVGQRAYEMNSKAIQTSDSMLQTAVQLKRS